MTAKGLPLRVVTQRLREARLLLSVLGPEDVVVRGLSQDSREVSPGDLFLAWKGTDYDAHDFLPQAARSGAVAAVVERPAPDLQICQLQVKDGRVGGALAADAVLGSPWRALFLVGVTGTNGKTTTAVLTRHLLQARGPARALGTLGLVEEGGGIRSGTEGLTTPGPVRLYTWIREMADDGVRFSALEASSHALAQHRLDGLRFDVGVFTNLTQDHLDYHADLDDYRLAKTRLLDLLKPGGWAVVNRDEPAWTNLPVPEARTVGFALGPENSPGGGVSGPSGAGADRPGDLRATDVELLSHGSTFRLQRGRERVAVSLPLLGRFNVENAMAAAGVASVVGLSLEEIADRLSTAPQVPGRLERVVAEPFTVLIDFAHTPDALRRVLQTLRPIVRGRLLVLFGAGGDRDRGKRPLMGAAVAEGADLAFVTSDNPRTEDPEAIIDDVVAGMEGALLRRIPDRREAIAEALDEARPGDLVLLAGKGHETYQVLGKERHPFVEREIVLAHLSTRRGG